MEKLPDRRRFLKDGAVLAGMAVGAVHAAGGETLEAQTTDVRPKDLHAYGERSRFETAIRTGSLGTWPQPTSPPDYHKDFGFRTPLQESIGILTPAPLHYIVSHGYEPPDIDPREHHLLIHGMVDRPLIFTLEDLRRLPSVTRDSFRRMQWEQRADRPDRHNPQGAKRKRAGYARLDQLQRLDRDSCFTVS